MSDVSGQQANWRPPGTANSIAVTYAHTVIAADADLNRRFHGREPLIAGEWKDRLGLGATFPDDWASRDIDWEALHAYGRDVRKCVEGLIDVMTLADLDRRFQMTPATLGVWKEDVTSGCTAARSLT